MPRVAMTAASLGETQEVASEVAVAAREEAPRAAGGKEGWEGWERATLGWAKMVAVEAERGPVVDMVGEVAMAKGTEEESEVQEAETAAAMVRAVVVMVREEVVAEAVVMVVGAMVRAVGWAAASAAAMEAAVVAAAAVAAAAAAAEAAMEVAVDGENAACADDVCGVYGGEAVVHVNEVYVNAKHPHTSALWRLCSSTTCRTHRS